MGFKYILHNIDAMGTLYMSVAFHQYQPVNSLANLAKISVMIFFILTPLYSTILHKVNQ